MRRIAPSEKNSANRRKRLSKAIVQQAGAQSYARFLAGIKEHIRTAQVKAALAANAELVRHYWEIGREILVQPRILARTVEIGRLFVRTDAGVSVEPESPALTTKAKSASKGRTLTESVFIDELAGNSALAAEVRTFFSALKDADFEIQPTARGLSLKVVPAGTKMNLLTLYPEGKVMNFGCGDSEVGREYLDRLKSLLPNAQIRVASDNGWSSSVMKSDGTYFRIEDVMQIRAPLLELLEDTKGRLHLAISPS